MRKIRRSYVFAILLGLSVTATMADRSYAATSALEEKIDDAVEKFKTIVCTDPNDTACPALAEKKIAAIEDNAKLIAERLKEYYGKDLTVSELEKIINEELSGNAVPFTNKDTRVNIVRTVAGIAFDDSEGLLAAAPLAVTMDADGDGMPDSIEEHLGTDPNQADSDGDGYGDKEEVLNGYDPLGPGRKDVELSDIEKSLLSGRALYQPKVSGTEDENFSVDGVKDADTGDSAKGYVIEGKAEPNRTVALYIYSDIPIVTTVTTDADGNWQYEFTEPLTDGGHEVYVAINDGTGKVTEKSKPFGFSVQQAKAISPSDLNIIQNTNTGGNKETPSDKTNSLMRTYVLVAAGATIVIGLTAFALFVLKKNKLQQ